MRIRLIWRLGIADSDGKCVGYTFLTDDIELSPEAEALSRRNEGLPELIGGEWLGHKPG